MADCFCVDRATRQQPILLKFEDVSQHMQPLVNEVRSLESQVKELRDLNVATELLELKDGMKQFKEMSLEICSLREEMRQLRELNDFQSAKLRERGDSLLSNDSDRVRHLETFLGREDFFPAAPRHDSFVSTPPVSRGSRSLDSPEASSENAESIPHLVALLSDRGQLVQEKAAEALGRLARDCAANRKAIPAAGGIEPLVRVVADGRPEAQERAAEALGRLAWDSSNRRAIPAAGGIKPLVQLLQAGRPEAQEKAAEALGRLAWEAQSRKPIADEGSLPPLVQLLTSGRPQAQEKAAEALGRLAWEAENRKAILDAGGLPPLLSLLKSGSPKLKEKAVGVLRELAWTEVAQEAIPAGGGLAPLVQMLGDGSPAGRGSASEALGNLAISKANQDAIAEAGAIPALVRLLGERVEAQGHRHQPVVYALSKLAETQAPAIAAEAGAIPGLVQALSGEGPPSPRQRAVSALCEVARIDTGRSAMATAGAIQPLVQLQRQGDEGEQGRASRLLKALAKSEECREAILGAGGQLE